LFFAPASVSALVGVFHCPDYSIYHYDIQVAILPIVCISLRDTIEGMSKKKTTFRDPESSGETKREQMLIRLEPGEKEAFRLAADLAGIGISAWVRERLRRIARQELEEARLPIPFIRAPKMD
jgi:hypothetical protein